MKIHYVAYGSNLHPLRLRARVGDAPLLGTAALENHEVRFHKRGNIDGSGKCNLVQRSGKRAYVAVYELSEKGAELLDEAEGLGNGYERATIEVSGFGRSMTYRAQETHIDDSLAPFTWYKDLVLAGCRYHRFPETYLESIEAIPAVRDPDPDRHALHRRLIEALTSDPAQS